MILDTNGLSALTEGEPGLEPLLRRAAQVAIPVIVLGEYRYGISQSRNHIHYEQWLAQYLPSFRFSTSMNGPPSHIVPFAESSRKRELPSLRTTFGLQHYAANIPYHC